MKILRRLKDNYLVYLVILLIAIWTITAIAVEIGFIVSHHRFPVSNYEIVNWVLGLAP